MLIVAVFGTLALLITAAGLYGIIGFIGSQRTREIGIRMALGARSKDVTHLVAGFAIAPELGGLILGTAGAFWIGRLLLALVEGARGIDPVIVVAGMCADRADGGVRGYRAGPGCDPGGSDRRPSRQLSRGGPIIRIESSFVADTRCPRRRRAFDTGSGSYTPANPRPQQAYAAFSNCRTRLSQSVSRFHLGKIRPTISKPLIPDCENRHPTII